HADRVLGVDHRDPILRMRAGGELEAGVVELEPGQDEAADDEVGDRRDEGDELVRLLFRPGDDEHDDRAHQRDEHRQGQRPVVESVHASCSYRTNVTRASASSAVAPKSSDPYCWTRPGWRRRNAWPRDSAPAP